MLADALLEVDFLRDTRRIRAAVAKLEARRTHIATGAATAALGRAAEAAREVSRKWRERGAVGMSTEAAGVSWRCPEGAGRGADGAA